LKCIEPIIPGGKIHPALAPFMDVNKSIIKQLERDALACCILDFIEKTKT
jgi:hypothetical protein